MTGNHASEVTVTHAHQMPHVMYMPGFSLGCIIHAVTHSQLSLAQLLGIQPITPRVLCCM